MSIEREILEYLFKEKRKVNRLNYKGIRVGFLGLPDFKYYKYQTLANRCSDLKKKGFVKEKDGNYFITNKGVDFLHGPNRILFKKFSGENSDKDPKNLLIIYDIPEQKRSEREWFRRQLKNLNFVMIQRSVWVGPSPLPEAFLKYVKEIGIQKTFKTFKLAKGFSFEK